MYSSYMGHGILDFQATTATPREPNQFASKVQSVGVRKFFNCLILGRLITSWSPHQNPPSKANMIDPCISGEFISCPKIQCLKFATCTNLFLMVAHFSRFNWYQLPASSHSTAPRVMRAAKLSPSTRLFQCQSIIFQFGGITHHLLTRPPKRCWQLSEKKGPFGDWCFFFWGGGGGRSNLFIVSLLLPLGFNVQKNGWTKQPNVGIVL